MQGMLQLNEQLDNLLELLYDFKERVKTTRELINMLIQSPNIGIGNEMGKLCSVRRNLLTITCSVYQAVSFIKEIKSVLYELS